MPGGGKAGTSTTVEDKGPWAPAQPQLGQILSDAKTLYETGIGAEAYDGPRYAGLGANTQAGLADMLAITGTPSAATTAGTDFATGLLSNGGMSAQTSTDLGSMRGDLDALRGTVNGITPGQNPYLDDLIAQSSNDAANQVAAKFSAGGRFGSGSFARAVADATGRIGTEARAGQYNTDMDRKLGGQQALLSGGQAIVGAGQNASQLASGLLSQLPMLDQLRQAPAQAKLTIGAIQDADQQAQNDSYQDAWRENQDSLFRNLGLYQASVQPIGGMGSQGTSFTKTTQPQAGIGQQLMGAGIGLLGALGKGGLFGSDERIKENIEQVGEMPDGLGVYSYDLKPEFGGGRQIGLLAQEVEQVKPDAVAETAQGIKAVDYAKATDGLLSGPIGLLSRPVEAPEAANDQPAGPVPPLAGPLAGSDGPSSPVEDEDDEALPLRKRRSAPPMKAAA